MAECNQKVRVAIVGYGGMGNWHARKISSLDCLELAGVYDIRQERIDFAHEKNYNTYDSFEAVLADETVKIVTVATPNHLHKEEAIAAMRAGKHVLCEKPVMMSSAELEEIMAVSKETGKVFYPRQNRRWDEDYRIVKKIYDEKLVGEVFNIECRVLGSRGIPGDWRGEKEFGGGMMLDWGVHLLDRLLAMVDEKVRYVFCSLTNVTNDRVDDGFKMHLTFESGLTAVMEVGTCHFANLPLWYVAGKDGTAVIDNWECEGKMVRLSSWEDKDATPILAGAGLTKTMAPRGDNSVQTLPLPKAEFDNNELYINLVETIDGAAEQIVTQEQALRVMRLMEAAIRSSETHSVVEFEV